MNLISDVDSMFIKLFKSVLVGLNICLYSVLFRYVPSCSFYCDLLYFTSFYLVYSICSSIFTLPVIKKDPTNW